MHIMEGYLPLAQAMAWTAVSMPSVILGMRRLVSHPDARDARMRLAAASAFTFLLSALKIPSVGGSCSHPTGTALGTLLVGASAMAPVTAVVLVFQALLLAHGGITTLGANVFAMGIVGPWVAVGVYQLGRRLGAPMLWCAGAAAVLGDLATYLTTSLQLALAHPEIAGSVGASFVRFAGVFAITQLPIAVLEGGLTVLVLRALPAETLGSLALLQPRVARTAVQRHSRRAVVIPAVLALLGVAVLGLGVTPGTRTGTDDQARALVSDIALPRVIDTPVPSPSAERVIFAAQGVGALVVLLIAVAGVRRRRA